jgi:hypothetical protein
MAQFGNLNTLERISILKENHSISSYRFVLSENPS